MSNFNRFDDHKIDKGIAGIGCLVLIFWLVSTLLGFALTGVIIWAIIHVVGMLG